MNEELLNRLDELEPEKLIFGVLPVVANKIQVVADKSMGVVTLKQWLLIVIILQFQDGPPTLTEVANVIGSSRQNIKQLALKLEEKGLLKIEKDSKDSRVLRFTVLPACMELFEKQVDYQEHFLELLYEGIGEEEKRILAKGMRKLLININNMEELVEGGYEI